jgi:uncharacterized protein (DUF488 family)
MPGKHIVYTIGHSNRPIDDFIELLEENGIELLVDVRTVPRSRVNPQFNKDELPGTLKRCGIDYLHMPSLGGLRNHLKGAPASHNTAWENASFRNYADYAETEAFREGLEELIAHARKQRTCYMCSEAVWWRCHRRIITDYMLARGMKVLHIMAPGKVTEAEMNENAVLHEDGTITYPGDQQELEL